MEFKSVFQGVHGRAPYFWQQRATEELARSGFWPSLHAPTGAGKTSLIDCWLTALANTESIDLPRRMYWVLDRRAVIDQVAEYGRDVVQTLSSSREPACERLYERLTAIGGGRAPEVRLWRGGLDDDQLHQAARAPLSSCGVTLVCTTVDQLGSRLLFSGYGVSTRSRPMHAALAGLDSVIVLDEAHLSMPLCATLRRVSNFQDDAPSAPAPALKVLSMSATPNGAVKRGFALTACELEEELIARRVRARKEATLIQGKGDGTAAFTQAARSAREAGASVVAVILNTVKQARNVREELARHDAALLVIGPCRPLDRAGLLSAIEPRRRGLTRAPLFVVGTQTLEVGLDLDFDALVTSCAPLPALTQRLGRLDRAGDLGRSSVTIIAPPESGCPIYGKATAETWKWLNEARKVNKGALDLGIAGLNALKTRKRAPVEADPPDALLLSAVHVEQLARTSFQHPWPIDPSLFLRAGESQRAEVQILWREDITLGMHEEEGAERIRARPPHAGEMLPVPLGAARSWLTAKPQVDICDLEGAGVHDKAPATREESLLSDPRATIIAHSMQIPPPDADGALHPTRADPSSLTPGSVIVVPCACGGADRFGWAPDSEKPVEDLGNLGLRRPAILLSHLRSSSVTALAAEVREQLDADEITLAEGYRALTGAVADAVRAQAQTSRHGARLRALAARISAAGTILPVGEGDLTLVPDRRQRESSSRSTVTLGEHSRQVEQRARTSATALGLCTQLVETISLAARHHDLGKRDPRFQAWLAPGVQDGVPLAKSGGRRDRRADTQARRAAGWPEGKRHEMVSAAAMEMLLGIAHVAPIVDVDLLVHLVLAHHGYGRPHFPPDEDDHQPSLLRLTIEGHTLELLGSARPDWAAHAERFATLNERYGYWGLALLESILVLADREASAGDDLP